MQRYFILKHFRVNFTDLTINHDQFGDFEKV